MKTESIVQLNEVLQESGDRVRVFLRDCRVDLQVGIYDTEKASPQPVVISVELEAALPHRYQDVNERQLARVISYEPIYDFIRKDLPALGHIHLLETVAEQIIAFCFRDPRVEIVKARLEKTAIFPHAAGAGIEIIRHRASA